MGVDVNPYDQRLRAKSISKREYIGALSTANN
jgi:hypothetical protein